jgi:excisionase family DNA binding protein
MESPDLYRLSDAAQRLSVSPGTLRRWRREGRIEFVRLPGGSLRVRSEDIERLLDREVARG